MLELAFTLTTARRYIDDVATATRVVDEHTIASLGSQLLRELDLSRSFAHDAMSRYVAVGHSQHRPVINVRL